MRPFLVSGSAYRSLVRMRHAKQRYAERLPLSVLLFPIGEVGSFALVNLLNGYAKRWVAGEITRGSVDSRI